MYKLKRKILSLAATFLTATQLVGAVNVYAEEGNEINYAVSYVGDNLDPTDQWNSWYVSRFGIGETLTRFDTNGQVQPYIATEWSVEEDGKKWVFTLRDDVKYSDGSEVTPENIKASLEYTYENAERAPEFFDLNSIEVDGQKLIINLNEAHANMAGNLADPLFVITKSSETPENVGEVGPIGTGPFVVSEYKQGEECVVEANDNYWNGEVAVDKANFKYIEEQATRSLALQSGEVDVALNLKPENIVEFEGLDGYEIDQLDSLRTTQAFINQNGVLGDKTLREAVIRGLDRKTYTDSLLDGGATAGKAVIPPTLDYGFDELTDPNEYNPDSAKKLLDEAGYKDIDNDGFRETPDGEPLELKFVIYTSREEHKVYAEAAQINLKEIGINLAIEVASDEQLGDIRANGDYDLFIWNMVVANTGDPATYLYDNYHSQSKTNTTAYKNDIVDANIDKLNSSFDEDERKELIIEIQQEILNDAATIVFGYETTYLFKKENVEGVDLYPMEYYWITSETGFTGN